MLPHPYNHVIVVSFFFKGKDILVIQKCECLNFLFCDCFVATSERKWIASLSESMCIIRHSDDILCLSNSTNNSTGAAALIEVVLKVERTVHPANNS